MQFDWFTFGASVFNFVLLLILLRVLVFKRIVRAMETREKRLARQWDEAQEAQHEAEEQQEHYRAELQKIEEKRKETLQETREELEAERDRRLEEVRQEMQEKRTAWEKSLSAEQEQFLSEVRNRLAGATIDIVRGTLKELADESLEEKMVDRFLRGFSSEAESVQGEVDGETLHVYTSQPLPEDVRERLKGRFSELLPGAAGVNVAVDESLLCGIEVRLTDRRLGFSLAHHLDSVEERLDQLLEESQAGTPAAEEGSQ